MRGLVLQIVDAGVVSSPAQPENRFETRILADKIFRSNDRRTISVYSKKSSLTTIHSTQIVAIKYFNRSAQPEAYEALLKLPSSPVVFFAISVRAILSEHATDNASQGV